jgi:hypothetical protein
MGLSLHYRLTAPAGTSAQGAAALVRRFHAIARGWAADGRVVEVDPIVSDRSCLERFGTAWRTLPHPDDPATSVGVPIRAEAGWIFPVDFGADCEWVWLGLCRYPATITIGGRKRATRLGGRWQLAHSCKTQYASLRGWENFVRCHVGAVNLIGEWRGLGGRVKIDDEGGYWPHRDLAGLRRRLEQMNGIVAALAGAVKDATDGARASPVQAPIFSHPQFERIEAEGQATHRAAVEAAVRIVSNLGRQAPGNAGQ